MSTSISASPALGGVGGTQERPRSQRSSLLWRAALPSLALAGGIGTLDYLRRRFQHSQTFLPERYPNGLWQPENYGVKAENVFFRASDGVELHAWWIPIRRARGTILYCHGNAGNITSRIGIYRFLRKARVNVLAFDYRGYGRSGGSPSEQGVFLDARAAWDFLAGEIGETPERIVLFGHSLGGAIAIDCAVNRPVAGLIAQSTFTDTREMARVRFPRIPLHLVARNQFRSFDKVTQLEVPKLFVHGTADETIPFQLGQRLYENAASPKEW
jgi:pimeloyl-ACP methyl ester carboxylesterase